MDGRIGEHLREASVRVELDATAGRADLEGGEGDPAEPDARRPL
jgi:hypothetical protein